MVQIEELIQEQEQALDQIELTIEEIQLEAIINLAEEQIPERVATIIESALVRQALPAELGQIELIIIVLVVPHVPQEHTVRLEAAKATTLLEAILLPEVTRLVEVALAEVAALGVVLAAVEVAPPKGIISNIAG